MSFGNVETVPDKGEEPQNVGEVVVARGFASVIKHRSDEVRPQTARPPLEPRPPAAQLNRCVTHASTQVCRPRRVCVAALLRAWRRWRARVQERSSVYEKLVECEDLAKSAKRGVHSAKEPAANRINDVSLPGSAAK